MKKLLFISMLVLFSAISFSQDTTNVQKIDTITARDFLIHKYLLGYDISEYQKEMYQDSINIREFYGKERIGHWFKTIGQYYLSPYENIPAGVQYLHRKPEYEGLIEQLLNKYNR